MQNVSSAVGILVVGFCAVGLGACGGGSSKGASGGGGANGGGGTTGTAGGGGSATAGAGGHQVDGGGDGIGGSPGGGGTVGGTVPGAVGGLFVWLEADRGPQVSGTSVAQWNDQSGNGYHALQPTVAAQPQLLASGLGGLPVVTFDGTQTLRWPTSPAMTTLTVFAVYQLPTALAYTRAYHPLSFGGPTNTAGLYTGIEIGSNSSGDSNALDIYGGFSDDERAAAPGIAASGPTTPYRILDWVSTNSHDTRAFWDGTAATMSPTGSQVSWNVQLGSGSASDFGGIGFCPACSGPDTSPVPVNVAEVIVYNRALTDADRQKAEGYLAWKWGLQASLPAGHPYASAAP